MWIREHVKVQSTFYILLNQWSQIEHSCVFWEGFQFWILKEYLQILKLYSPFEFHICSFLLHLQIQNLYIYFNSNNTCWFVIYGKKKLKITNSYLVSKIGVSTDHKVNWIKRTCMDMETIVSLNTIVCMSMNVQTDHSL